MGGSVQPKDVPITFIDRKPKIGTKIKNLILGALGYGNKLSRTAHVGRQALPAHPIHAPQIRITEPAAVATHELNRIKEANDRDAQERRDRKSVV